MPGSWVSLVLMLAAGAAIGFVLYEALLRKFDMSSKKQPSSLESKNKNRVREAKSKASGEKNVSTIVALAQRLERLLPMTRKEGDAYRRALARAGWSIKPETWRGLRLISAAVFATCACALVVSSKSADPLLAGVVLAAFVGVGWMAPTLILDSSAAKRREAMEAQLPDALELLGITLSAGSPVEQCFREVAGNLEEPLASEFELVNIEVNFLGHSREQALSNLAERCASRDISAFVAQFTQAVNQGSSIAEGLASQAALAHEAAQAKTLERIRKMSTKLDMVLSFCFLPPTIALVLVPTVVNLIHFLNDTL